MADLTIEDELALIKGKGAAATVSAVVPPAPAAAPTNPQATTPAPDVDPEADLPPPEADLPSPPETAGTWDAMSAAWQDATIRSDAWNYHNRQRNALIQEMFDKLPPEKQLEVRRRIPAFGSSGGFYKEVLDAAARDAASSAEAASKWGQSPLTEEAFNLKIREQIIADQREAKAILGQPGGGVAEFLGSGARTMIEPVSLLATAAGAFTGGASAAAWRIIASEAALNAGAEGVSAYNEIQIAREFGWEEPDIGSRMLIGGVLGGALTGAVVGGSRLLSKFQAKRASTQAAVPEGADPLDAEVKIDAAEAALRNEPTPQELAGPTLPSIIGAENLPYNEGAVLRAIIGVESGGNPSAKNPNSSAYGLGQFIGSTWLSMIKKHRPDIATGKTDSEILTLRGDPNLSAEMTAMYTRENAANLQANGLTADPGSLYMSHFMGPGGAVRALKSPLDTPIAQLMSPKEIAANAGIRYGGKSFRDFTAGDLRRWAAHKMRSAYDPNARSDMPVFDTTSRGYTGAGQVKVGDDMTIDVDYEVVDAATLTRASGPYQPRDRSRVNSDAWIADTAARLDPAQLMRSPTADRGAPIVGPDNMIESGNGRFGAILRAYERHPDRVAAYRGAIEAQGFAIPDGVERPVLVARRRTELDDAGRQRLTVAAQDSGVAVMTPTEMAQVAARTLTPERLDRLDLRADITAPENADFLRRFMEAMPRSQRNAMADGEGGLNGYGRRQLREALFARAWEDPDIIELMTEGQRGDLKGLFNALEEAAPAWAALKADIEAGRVVPDMDISGHVLDAMRIIATARRIATRDKQPLASVLNDMLNSPDMIEGALAPLTAALLRKFWRNGRAAPEDEITSFLTRYADEARKAGVGGGLFDTPGPRDVLGAIDRATFGDLPADLGPVRGFARAGQEAPRVEPPPAAFADGTASPEVEAADQAGRALMRPISEAPVTFYERGPVEEPVTLIEHKGTTIRSLGVLGDDDPFEMHKLILPDGTKVLASVQKRGEILRIMNIENLEAGVGTEAFNSVGTAQMRRVLAAYRALDPELRALSGERIGGARRGGGWSMRPGQEVMVPLREMSIDGPNVTNRSDPELDAIQTEIATARAAMGDDMAELEFDMEGVGKVRLSEFLDDIDADTAHAAVLRACAIGGE